MIHCKQWIDESFKNYSDAKNNYYLRLHARKQRDPIKEPKAQFFLFFNVECVFQCRSLLDVLHNRTTLVKLKFKISIIWILSKIKIKKQTDKTVFFLVLFQISRSHDVNSPLLTSYESNIWNNTRKKTVFSLWFCMWDTYYTLYMYRNAEFRPLFFSYFN